MAELPPVEPPWNQHGINDEDIPWYHRLAVFVKPYVGFSTKRTVNILDAKLGTLYYVLACLATVYTLYNIIGAQTYLAYSEIVGLVTPYVENYHNTTDGTEVSFLHAQSEFYNGLSAQNGSAYKYCSNDTYNFQYSSAYSYSNLTCKGIDPSEIWVKESTEIFVKTAGVENLRKFFRMTSDEDNCTYSAFDKYGGCHPRSVLEVRVGRCYCKSERNNFFYGAENLTLVLDDKYNSLFGSGSRSKTFVRRRGEDKDYKIVESDQYVHLPIYELLDIAGVDLDSRNTNKDLQGTDPEGNPIYPFRRLTGAILELSFIYGNYKESPSGHKLKRTVEKTLEVEAIEAWSSNGNDPVYNTYSYTREADYRNVYSYGILIKVNTGGFVAKFDVAAFVQALVSGMVMLNLALTVTVFIATNNPFESSSKLYKEAIKANYNMRKTYTKFALKAMHSMAEFRRIDNDQSGYISRHEIYEMVSKSFGEIESSMSTEDYKVEPTGPLLSLSELCQDAPLAFK
ncbi:hypothetical protein CYMTET_27859, partial [Cymbomonas tetramitiformis]